MNKQKDNINEKVNLNSAKDERVEDEGSEIRSVAIVKKSQFDSPVSFRELKSNTDLKNPPSNWLRGQFSMFFPNLTSRRSDFTSFIMGYQFPDSIGEVDIISDAENIKKLLKMAYKPNTHLSMMVHRIGKTLLIDEFDIYKYLLRHSETQWKWLRKFFYTHILDTLAVKEDSVIVRPDKSRQVVQSKNLLSKFLYHSVEEEKLVPSVNEDQSKPEQPVSIFSPAREVPLDSQTDDQAFDSPVQSFSRNVIWKFEDLCMLIGTDLPIFGGRTHPCVSLRLRDMDKPINILTGIDYWLDNLMCNVPEVIMCYHQNGIVQKYELVKTEDLPHMPDSQFSTQLVTDIAHNILSFLKSKATKEGHTYWLFKGKDDDIVKLYDLTSLYNEDDIFESFLNEEQKSQEPEPKEESNPFTIPVAVLFYYVAKNLWNSKDDLETDFEPCNKHSTVKNLLENAISLLSESAKGKYLKIYTQANLILADVYLPQQFDPESPELDDIKKENLDFTKSSETSTKSPAEIIGKGGAKPKKKYSSQVVTSACNSISYSSLFGKRSNKKQKHKSNEGLPNLSSNVYERCNSAMNHVIEGLNSILLYSGELNSPSSSPQKNKDAQESTFQPRHHQTRGEEEQVFAKPFVPIPMPYESLNKLIERDKSQAKNEVDNIDNEVSPGDDVNPETSGESSNKNIGNDSGLSKQKMSIYDSFKETSKLEKSHSKNSEPNVVATKTLLTKTLLNSQLKGASWVEKITFQLLRKASLVYMTKGRIELDASQYGLCLRYAKLTLRTWCSMLSLLNPEVEFPLPSQPLLLAGDAYYCLAKFWDVAPFHIEQFNCLTDEMQQMNEILDKLDTAEDCSWRIKIPCDSVDALSLSYNAFETASRHIGPPSQASLPDRQLLRRLASICNELGCVYMNQADQICHNVKGDVRCASDLWEDSWRFLDKASEIFRGVDDNDNLALVHCNRGRYLRLCAFHQSSIGGKQVFSTAVKDNYEKAFTEYEMALGLLHPSGHQAGLMDSIVWEYSTSLYSFGTIVQDALSVEEQDDEETMKYASTIFNKCLKLCDTKSSTRELLYQYRAGAIHARLAAIHHTKFKRNKDQKMMHLADMYYQKSADCFLRLHSSPSDILQVHLDHVRLLEDLLDGVKSQTSQWKHLLSILELLSKCQSGLSLIEKQKGFASTGESGNRATRSDSQSKAQQQRDNVVESEPRTEQKDDSDEERELVEFLVNVFEKKLNSTLLSLLKLTRSNKALSKHEADAKTMYFASLNKDKKCNWAHLLEAISTVTPIAQKIAQSSVR